MKARATLLLMAWAAVAGAQDVAVEEFGAAEVVLVEAQRAREAGDPATARAKAERAASLAGDDADLARRASALAAECACEHRDKDAGELVLGFLRAWPGAWDADAPPGCAAGLLRGALRKRIGWLRFPGMPENASLAVGGRDAQAGPSLTLPAGKVVLRGAAPGFAPFSLEADVAPAKETPVDLPWKAVARPLRMFVKPDGARVFLNNVEVGVAAALAAGSPEAAELPGAEGWGFLHVAPRAFGDFLMRIEAPCYQPRNLELHVPEEGAPAPLTLAPLQLVPLEVALELEGPAGGLVSVDGILIGKMGQSLTLCGGRHQVSVAWPEGEFHAEVDVREDRPVQLRVAPRWNLAFLGILNRRPGVEYLPTLEQQWEQILPQVFPFQNLLAPSRTTQTQTLLQALLDSPADARAGYLERLAVNADVFLFGEALEGSPFKAGRVHLMSRDGLLETFEAPALDRAGGLWSEARNARIPQAGTLPGGWRLEEDGWRVTTPDPEGRLRAGDLLLEVDGRSLGAVRDLGQFLAHTAGAEPVPCRIQRGAASLDLSLPVRLWIQLPAPTDVPRPRLVVRAQARFASLLPDADRDGCWLLEGLALEALGAHDLAAQAWARVTSAEPGALNATTARFLLHRIGKGPAPGAADPPGALDRRNGLPVPRS